MCHHTLHSVSCFLLLEMTISRALCLSIVHVTITQWLQLEVLSALPMTPVSIRLGEASANHQPCMASSCSTLGDPHQQHTVLCCTWLPLVPQPTVCPTSFPGHLVLSSALRGPRQRRKECEHPHLPYLTLSPLPHHTATGPRVFLPLVGQGRLVAPGPPI